MKDMTLRKVLLTCCLTLALALASAPAPAAAQDVAGDLLGRINTLRASLGLPAYRLNSALSAAAQSHAAWMAETGQVSHTQPNGSTPSTRAAAAGYPGSWVSENIYAGSNAGAGDAWFFWVNSPTHYRGLTNASYDEIGIGFAQGSRSRAFVLVFGASGSPVVRVAPSASGGAGGGGTARAQPSFVVGLDNAGNIMHEIQEGHTVGDIALIYGYTWSDIPAMLALNNLDEADMRRLKVGSIFLVPPWDGTYTPTPGGPTATPGIEQQLMTAVANITALPATPTPPPALAPTETPEPVVVLPRIATAASVPDALNPPAAETGVPALPSQLAALSATAAFAATDTPSSAATQVAQLSSNPPPGDAAPPRDVIIIRDGTPPWLIGVLLIQSLVIGFAALEFIRRARR